MKLSYGKGHKEARFAVIVSVKRQYIRASRRNRYICKVQMYIYILCTSVAPVGASARRVQYVLRGRGAGVNVCRALRLKT